MHRALLQGRIAPTRKRALATAVTALLVSLLVPLAGAEASVPGLSFTETGCEEHSDSVARLYTAGLDREPEEGGFDFWMTQYTSGHQTFESMAAFFVTSPEFEGNYGNLTDLQLVNQLYINILGRPSEPGGTTFWTGQLADGMSRATLLMRLAESPENIGASKTHAPALGEFNEGRSEPWNCEGTKWIGVPSTYAPGTYFVGDQIPAGRYTLQARNGCYWERLSGTGGTFDEIIANDFVADASRRIVDIDATDNAFSFDTRCGQLAQFVPGPSTSSLSPGMYVVGQEATAGTYTSQATANCYWESAIGAGGNVSNIVSNEFVTTPGQIIVTLRAGEIFTTTPECGTWTIH